MNLHIEHAHGLAVVRVDETRLMYPLLSDFSGAVLGPISGGEKKLLIDLSKVTYVDSATIGCFMDLYRQASAAGSMLKLFLMASGCALKGPSGLSPTAAPTRNTPALSFTGKYR